VDLRLLTLCMVICPDPGVERVVMHAKVTSSLGKGVLRLDGQFDRTFLQSLSEKWSAW
jgi:hypothetical protein